MNVREASVEFGEAFEAFLRSGPSISLAEDYLARLLADRAVGFLASNSSVRSKFVRIAEGRFQWSDGIYKAEAGFGVREWDELDFAVHRVAPGYVNSIPTEIEVPINSSGRIRVVHLSVDNPLDRFAENLAEFTRTGVESAYRSSELWLAEELSDRQDSARAIHRHGRSILKEDISKRVRYHVITEHDGEMRGCYVFDSDAVHDSIRTASEARRLVSKSAIEAVAGAARHSVDYARMFSKEAIDQNKVIAANLLNAKYSDTGINLDELGLYGGDAAVQPLVREGSSLLVAAYPLSLRSQVERTLREHAAGFQRIVANHHSGFMKILARIVSGDNDRDFLGKTAHVIGRLAGAYSKELLAH